MANSSSLLKTLLHKTIAEGLYKEVLSRTSRYYYFLGKTLSWEDEATPLIPVDSFQYEKDTRNEIITYKEIKPSDVAFTVPRINWISGDIYDIYDDNYSTEVIGINLTNGGGSYISTPIITIDPPDLTDGLQATAQAVIYNNQVVDVVMLHKGSGYTNPPAVTFSGGGTAAVQAIGVGVIGKSANGFQKLEDALFYVMTDEYNVYKCLDNNNGARSTTKPIGTQILPIKLSDGYVWKYMYNVPIALRTKFLTSDQMPVITALSQQFYSAGGIENVQIDNRGLNYTAANLSVSGDGYLESDPVFLSSTITTNIGQDYSDSDTFIIAQPYETSSVWLASKSYALGTKLLSNNNIYEVVQAGTTSSVAPNHKRDVVANGTTSLKYLGTTAKAFPTFYSGTAFPATTAVLVGNQYVVSTRVYVVTQSGTTGASGPTGTVVGVAENNGTAKFAYVSRTNGISAINLVGGVKEINLTAFGNGYTSNPTVTFTPSTLTFNSSGVNTSTGIITVGAHWFSTGDQVVYNNGGGTRIGGLVNNTTYYIIKATSTTIKLATTYNDAIAGTRVTITSTGSGAAQNLYNSDSYPSAYAEISPTGVVKRIKIIDPGNNYITPPTITIGNPWTASTAVTLGQQYFTANRLYTVTTAGTTHASTAPTSAQNALGTAYTNGTASLTYVGQAASATCSLRYGAGYSGNPSISVLTTTGSNFSASFTSLKSDAKLIPILENGQIVSVQVDDPGVGYSSATINVAGDGTGAVVTPDISIGNINTLQANNELLTTSGTLDNIQVISQGYAYGTATVTINGDGTGATATAIVFGGKITKITMTNRGAGYTYADIIITGNGWGAKARAVISPFPGHGKDAFEELFTRTLIFYSNVSKDKNQGFDVNNDYRQVGIIKNPRNYAATTRYASATGSACFVLEADYDIAQFTKDMMLTTPRVVDGVTFYRKYRIVTENTTGTGMLVQCLDNDPPQVADVMTNINNQFFTVKAVGAPTVDKYSGDMLFIDNKAGFTPSADETVTLRTVIKF
jgi:hypothetical protein